MEETNVLSQTDTGGGEVLLVGVVAQQAFDLLEETNTISNSVSYLIFLIPSLASKVIPNQVDCSILNPE
tara:strand:+ start:481 stop:687 length:207 start_codon:yes stop_codon:yes gene_type:complete